MARAGRGYPLHPQLRVVKHVPLPAAPTSLVATAISSSQIDLTWVDNSTNEDGYKIERSPAGAGTWVEIDDEPAGTTSYSNTGLAGGTSYDYRVRAYNVHGYSGYSNTATATTAIDSVPGRRPRGLPSLPHVVWTVDDREVPAGDDWRATTRANGGFDSASLSIPEKYARRYPSSLAQMAPVRAYEDTGGPPIWEGRLVVDPAIENARAALEAQGAMHEAQERFGRLLYQSFDTGLWADENGSPFGGDGASSISVGAGEGKLEWRIDQGQDMVPNDSHGCVLWAPETSMRRIACSLLVSGDTTDCGLEVFTCDGPDGTRVGVGSFTLFPGAYSVEIGGANRKDMIGISLGYGGTAQTRTDSLRVVAYRVRVNDIATGDSLESENIAKDVAQRLGWDTSGVPVGSPIGGALGDITVTRSSGQPGSQASLGTSITYDNQVEESALNVLPIDWKDASWASLLDYLALITDYRWRALANSYGAGPVFEYGPWGPTNTVFLAKGAQVRLRPQPRFNRVVVKYNHAAAKGNSGGAGAGATSGEYMKHADPDPFEHFKVGGSELVKSLEERLQDSQPDGDLAVRVAELLLARASELRLAGDIQITSPGAYRTIAGNLLQVGDDSANSGIALRITQTEMGRDGTRAGIESLVSVGSVLAMSEQEFIRRPFGALSAGI